MIAWWRGSTCPTELKKLRTRWLNRAWSSKKSHFAPSHSLKSSNQTLKCLRVLRSFQVLYWRLMMKSGLICIRLHNLHLLIRRPNRRTTVRSKSNGLLRRASCVKKSGLWKNVSDLLILRKRSWGERVKSTRWRLKRERISQEGNQYSLT